MIALTDIQKSLSIIEDLASNFDFDLARASRDHSWIKLVPHRPFLVIAGESTGGVFLAYDGGEAEPWPILYATSEGQAGCIAANLTEMVAMMMAAPYWRDLLKFSDAGNLTEMRKSAWLLEQDYLEEDAAISDARRRIMDGLPIPVITDPVKLLHDRVGTTDCTLIADDGWHYESLFNKFKSSDNPFWRQIPVQDV